MTNVWPSSVRSGKPKTSPSRHAVAAVGDDGGAKSLPERRRRGDRADRPQDGLHRGGRAGVAPRSCSICCSRPATAGSSTSRAQAGSVITCAGRLIADEGVVEIDVDLLAVISPNRDAIDPRDRHAGFFGDHGRRPHAGPSGSRRTNVRAGRRGHVSGRPGNWCCRARPRPESGPSVAAWLIAWPCST